MQMSEPMTKQRLSQYIALRLECEHQLERIERMKLAEQIPPQREGDGSQHSGAANDKMATAVIKRLELEEKVRPMIEANEKEMRTIEYAIDRLDNPLEREVLRLRYIDGQNSRHMPWGDVSNRLFGECDEKHLMSTHRLHGRALANINKSRP